MRVGRDQRLDEIEVLYRARFPHFLRVARAIVGDPERATEAVQDGFASVIKARESFRGDGPLEAWVWRAVVNAARKSARRPLIEPTLVGAEATYEVSLDRLDIAPLIARLPERQRLIVFLRYIGDLDYRSIAMTLEVELGTVSAALATAHAAIRKGLQEVETHDRR